MDKGSRDIFSRELNIKIKHLSLIQRNKYCSIYRASLPEGLRIIKKYGGDDPDLARTEAKALTFYHEIARNNAHVMDSGLPVLMEDKNLLMIGFVEGRPFNEVLYGAVSQSAQRAGCCSHMFTLGRLVRELHFKSLRPGDVTSPFIFEYMEYCSKRLNDSIPFGTLIFRSMVSSGGALAEALRACPEPPSFVHGDLVFKNIHVTADKIGLIDFANANYHSHPLNDICNLRLSLANMFLPRTFKNDLLRNFYDGLGPMDFPEAIHRFYYEYHRRRWLMLKLLSGSPRELLEGLRGLFFFAKPFTAKALAK